MIHLSNTRKSLSRIVVVFAALLAADAAQACDITLSPGANIQTTLNNAAWPNVCLSAGTYNLSTQLNVPSGRTLQGLGATRDDVVLVSSADIAVYLNSNTQIKNLKIQAAAGTSPTYGILTYYTSNIVVWGLRVAGADINIGINGSSDVHVWDTFMSLNGRNNGSADPNMWITDAHAIDVQWGEALGRNNGPGGDGEIAAYDSTNVTIYGTYVTNSGASAIYLVNCDSCKVENATITNANEWGLDIVNGTDSFIAKDNKISGSYWGGSVFNGSGYSNNNLNGQYINNNFSNNNRSGARQLCNGINYSGAASSFRVTGSTGNPTLLCKAW